jgi:hypothetical protein
VATATGVGSIRIFDQVKAYKRGHVVTADDVRQCWVLSLELGNPRNLTNKGRRKGNGISAATRTDRALQRAQDLAPTIAKIQAEGASSLCEIADVLTKREKVPHRRAANGRPPWSQGCSLDSTRLDDGRLYSTLRSPLAPTCSLVSTLCVGAFCFRLRTTGDQQECRSNPADFPFGTGEIRS